MERLASELGAEGQRLRARVEAGYRLTLLGRLDEALEAHRLLTGELVGMEHDVARNRNEQCLAIVLRLLGRYEESLAAHDRSGEGSAGDGARHNTWLNSRGHTLWRMGRYREAVESFQEVLSWAGRDSLIVHQATAHNNLGLVYSDMEMLEKAREHHQESLRLRTVLHDSGAICSSYLNLGNVMVQSGESRAGKELWGKALDISRQLGDAATEAMIENNMGEVSYNSGDFPTALAHFRKSLGMKEKLNLLSYLDTSLEGLVKTFYELRKDPECLKQCRLYAERLLALEAARPQKKENIRGMLAVLDAEGAAGSEREGAR
jgi:tetratricopeptide (TPR) repeat protein